MSWLANDLPTLITLLIPGFVAAGVFYTLTAHPKTGEFERVIQALIFTVFIKPATALAHYLLIEMGMALERAGRRPLATWTTEAELSVSLVIAVLLGLVFAWFSNCDWFHSFFRWMGLTTRTSHPSEWYSAFAGTRLNVVLHLEGGRRLRGWPLEWPDQADRGHFVIMFPAWLLDDGSEASLLVTEKFRVPVKTVEMVEFLKDPPTIAESSDAVEQVREQLISLNRKPAKGDSTNGCEGPSTSP